MSIKTYFVQGKSNFAKVLGAPVKGFDDNTFEWTVDLLLDAENKKKLLESGVDKFYVKEDKEGQEYVRFTRKAVKKDGTKANPIEVIGPDGQPWPQDRLIGNGSVLNIKYSINEVKSQGKPRRKPYCLAIQIWEHEPYRLNTGFPTKTSNILEDEDWAAA